MDTNLIFEDTLLDELSSTPTQHLTYILKHLLPVRLIGRHRLEKVDSEFYLKGMSQDADDDVIVMPVGSLAEALNMPPVILKNEKEVKGDYYTDIDLMFIAKIPALTFDQKRVLSDEHLVLVETDGIHPGYARLYKSKKYVNHSTFQNDIKSSITGIYADIATEVNGPAVTTPKVVDMTLQNFHRSTASGSNPTCPTDHVMALASKEWPDIADAWKTRKRSNGWLSEEIIISLTSGGCHVVPVPHRSSMSPDIEWRISFTYTERRIAREVLTDHQRQGYITLKLIYNHALKNLDIISSYHLKTIFFYACERYPSWHGRKTSAHVSFICSTCFWNV